MLEGGAALSNPVQGSDPHPMRRVAARADKSGRHPSTTRHRNKTWHLSNASSGSATECPLPPPPQPARHRHGHAPRRDDSAERRRPTRMRHPPRLLFQGTSQVIAPPEYRSLMTHDAHLARADDQERRAHSPALLTAIHSGIGAPVARVRVHFFPVSGDQMTTQFDVVARQQWHQ